MLSANLVLRLPYYFTLDEFITCITGGTCLPPTPAPPVVGTSSSRTPTQAQEGQRAAGPSQSQMSEVQRAPTSTGLSAEFEQLIQQFQTITGATRERAIGLLTRHSNNLNRAVNDFFESEENEMY